MMARLAAALMLDSWTLLNDRTRAGKEEIAAG